MTFKEFFEKNKDNNELQEKVKNCKSIEEVYELAKVNGLTDSFETLKSETKNIVIKSVELSEEEVASVSAGKCTQDSETTAFTATTSLASAAFICNI